MAAKRFTLFVAKLPWTVGRVTLREHFQQYGKVKLSKVAYDLDTGRSKQYGFIEFESSEDGKRALAETSHFIDGARVKVAYQEPRQFHDQQQVKDFSEV
ncbi:hypothetical protein OS493_020267 [Desmophyllum pertusum]|uniref:RRM domain-containing protein n=1 Tax=Desmophyllum pertusum TaxID=174260 RepID=A0A9X0D2Z3_9CNID|nr:hypothetical protein OS493_020267 [Desmophyllum pertusum]